MFRGLLRSFKHAFDGLLYCIINERNFRIHVVAAVIVYWISPYYEFTRAEMVLITVVITLVMVTEMVNTSVERAINMITTNYHPLAKAIKDVTAGSVLVTSINAVVCSVLLFFQPDVIIYIINDISGSLSKIALFIATVVVALIFVNGSITEAHTSSGHKAKIEAEMYEGGRGKH